MNISNSKFIQEIKETTINMYSLGWNERSAGNISVHLKDEEVAPYLSELSDIRKFPLPITFKELAGKYFVITGIGRYFKNISKNPIPINWKILTDSPA